MLEERGQTMMWLFAILVVLVLGGVAAAAAGGAGTLPAVERVSGLEDLPEGPLGAAELRQVRFPLAVRGYRMRDVDALLDRLAGQLEQPQHPVSAQSDNDSA
ncbi:DivIVA domain-containing protein [Nocardioides houyundeii]|uniref:DivIVA domain-containing protein n=1 Tax=Nocardioides houyundeii TaxID=2045452 RepID=UPI001F07B022|nr:DivIVA domain-containing protein [Nocardioides houyundeii]